MKRNLVLKFAVSLSLALLSAAAMAQDVHYNYDRDANFAAYKTYQWDVPEKPGDSLRDRDIRRAVENQLAQKGLVRVDSTSDLQIAYQTAIDHEKHLDGWSMGPRWSAMGHATVSTVQIGTLVLSFYDPSIKRLVWRGSVSKTLNINKDPDKNYRNLEKAVAKLLHNYPPRAGQ